MNFVNVRKTPLPCVGPLRGVHDLAPFEKNAGTGQSASNSGGGRALAGAGKAIDE